MPDIFKERQDGRLRYFSECGVCHIVREISNTCYSNIVHGRNSGKCKPCSLKGMPFSKERRLHINQALSGKPGANRGRKFVNISGENSPKWKGGITPIYNAVRSSAEYDAWRLAVFTRDGFSCVECGDDAGHNLQAHHKHRFSTIMSERRILTLIDALACDALWDVANGITLCGSCHKKEHVKAGQQTKQKAPNFYT